MIPYGRQQISDDDIAAVTEVLQSDFLTTGPAVDNFEHSVAEYCGVKHAVAVNSATSALHIACMALDVGPQDEVWTSPITFVASANCALYCGASVDFVDIDPATWNLCADALEKKLQQKAANNERLPKVVIPVHLCGQSCDMARIHALSERYGFAVIEDASHAIGGYYQDRPIGDCRFSDITVFSFHPVKIVTTAEGGIAATEDQTLDQRMRLARSHGITRNFEELTTQNEGSWYYEQQSLGYNYRMTDLQAALGVSQMQRLDEFVRTRHQLATRYDEALNNLPVSCPTHLPDTYSAYHLYVITLDEPLAGHRRDVFEALREAGIGVNVHYIPVHLQPYYRNMGYNPGDFPQAESYYRRAITLPLHPSLSHEEQDMVIRSLSTTIQSVYP